jgi:hypothetical protein
MTGDDRSAKLESNARGFDRAATKMIEPPDRAGLEVGKTT